MKTPKLLLLLLSIVLIYVFDTTFDRGLKVRLFVGESHPKMIKRQGDVHKLYILGSRVSQSPRSIVLPGGLRHSPQSPHSTVLQGCFRYAVQSPRRTLSQG